MTESTKRRSFLRTVGTVGVAGLAGCATDGNGNGGGNGNGNGGGNGGGNGNGNGNGGGTEGTPASEEAIQIGVETLLSGPFAIQGKPSRSAAELAAQQFNDEGGIGGREVDLTVVDSEASPETAIQRVRQMQQDGVEIIISQSGSAVGRAVSQFCADNNMLNFAGGYSADFSGADCNRNTFMPFPNLVHILGAHTRGAAEMTDGTTIAGVNPDYSYGRQSWTLFKEGFQQQVDGAEVVAETFPSFGKGDYQQEISAILDAEPDIVHSSLYAGDMISFIQQAKQRDFFEQVPVFAPSGTYDPVASSLGSEMPEVLAGLPYFYTHPDTELNNQFASAFIDHHGSPPTGNAHNVYSDMLTIKAAVEESGSTAIDDLISTMEGLELEVPGGALSIRAADHQGILESLPVGWGGGSFEEDQPYAPLRDIMAVPGSDVVEDPGDCSL